MLNSLSSWQIHYINRITNKAANGLAQAAIKTVYKSSLDGINP
jgi:hypothetical protein